MDVAELRLLVGRFVDPASLASCIRVSKLWYMTFLPVLYASIYYSDQEHDPNNPPEQALRRHAVDIRSLHISVGNAPSCYFARRWTENPCTNLELLYLKHSIHPHSSTAGPRYPVVAWDVTNTLLTTCPRLRAITLNLNEIPIPVLLMIRTNCKFLTDLRLHYVRLDEKGSEILLSICVALKTLETRSIEMVNPAKSFKTEWPRFPVMRELVLSFKPLPVPTLPGSRVVKPLTHENLLNWIQSCPLLESLTCRETSLNYSLDAATELCELMNKNYCPNLHKIDILSKRPTIATIPAGEIRQDWQLVFDKYPKLTTIAMPCYLWSQHSLIETQMLKKHFQSLEAVDLDFCAVKSWAIQQILTSCPNLLSFRTNMFDAQELVAEPNAYQHREIEYSQIPFEEWRKPLSPIPTRWVCTKLRVLSMAIVGAEAAWQIQIFAQLSRLKELQWVDFGYYRSPQANQNLTPSALQRNGPDFTLSAGMGLLCTWKKLLYLGVQGTDQRMELHDLRWMKKCWPNLMFLSSELNTFDRVRNATLIKSIKRECPRIELMGSSVNRPDMIHWMEFLRTRGANELRERFVNKVSTLTSHHRV
ncbi:hypothetical protein BGZ83_008856 [Gryganskiella cystojenkinii]|nr:hypothetical protein BGZ83_008856 [Gryganskiella cystojenkinii]